MSKQPRDKYGRFGSTHGTRTVHLAERYSDKRTVEAQRLNGIVDAIVADLGGHSDLSAGDRLSIDMLRSKLMIILQLGDWVDRQKKIIVDNKLLSAIGSDYIRYMESAEKTLQLLYRGFDRGRPTQTLEEYMKTRKSE